MFSFYQIFTYLMILVFIYLFFTKTNVSLAFFSLTVILWIWTMECDLYALCLLYTSDAADE